MLTFRNMREMTKDEIKVFLREGRKIGCAVHIKEERQELWKHFLVQKKRDSLSLYWYMKKMC